MSVPEILFRIRQAVRALWIYYLFRKHKPELIKFSSRPEVLKLCTPNDSQNYSNNIEIFGINFSFNNSEINWNQDISSGISFPLIFYRKINILADERFSAKYVWEVNRLQYLTSICFKYRFSRDLNSLKLFIDLNRSWNENNPYLTGINWYSNIEINLRLITWFLCWEILDADSIITENKEFKDFVHSDWIPTIYQHCIYSFNNPSKYSSANNHLISEYTGLFIASSKWSFKESEEWCSYGKMGLEKEILAQHSPAGVNREEAAGYIQFITDFFLLAYIVGKNTDNSFSDQYKGMLFNIFSYLYNLIDINGNYPKYGDEDDGRCFMLDFNENFNNLKSLMTSAAIIFDSSAFKSKSNGFDIKNQILFGETGHEIFDRLPLCSYDETSRLYKEEGHFILRKKHEKSEIFLHFNAAPLGFLSIAAHGHADALSFVLHIDGYPVFIDPGTYTYHTEPAWRKYFIGTLAHNTVRINLKDQAMNAGPTMWIDHYTNRVLVAESDEKTDRIVATHNGYRKENCQHIRELIFNKQDDEIIIFDTVQILKKRNTIVEVPFHLHPDISLSAMDNTISLSHEKIGGRLVFKIDDKLKPEILTGQADPLIIGWYSESFMRKEPSSTIYCKTHINHTSVFKFIIKIIRNEH